MGFIKSSSEFLDNYTPHQSVVINQSTSSIGNQKFKLSDISIQYDKKQDIYVQNPDLTLNVRNNSSIIQIKGQTLWARKSLPFIFEYRLEYLWDPLDHQYEAFVKTIFHRSRQALSKNNKLQIVKVELVDGTNAQISYIPQLDAWNIGSYNCSLVARHSQDIKGYETEFKKDNPIFEVSREWFYCIKRMKIQDLQDLKSILTDHTLVGDLVTSNYIVKYKKEQQFVWSARVNHYSSDVCIDIFETKKLLGRIGFQFSKTKSMAILNSFNNLRELVETLAAKTFESSLSSKQYGKMGFILYFIEHRIKDNDVHLQVIGATKVLTLEYQLYQHISYLFQEVCDNLKSKNTISDEDYIAQFEQQWTDRLFVYKCFPPFPLRHYSSILKKGLIIIKKFRLSKKFFLNGFNSFVNSILYSQIKNIDITEDLIFNKKLPKRLQTIQFSDYGSIGCKNVIIYIPLGIYGIGKTYLSKIMEDNFKRLGCRFKTLRTVSLEDELNTVMKQMIEQPSNRNSYFLFLDVSCSFQQSCRMIDDLKQSNSTQCYFKVVYIVPKQNRLLVKDDEYPFSLNDVLVSLKNISKKTKDMQYLLRAISILKSYRNVVLRENIHQPVEFQFPFLGVKISGNQQRIGYLVQSMLSRSKIKVQIVEQLVRLLQGVEIVHPNSQIVENEVDQLINTGFVKIPTVHL